MSDYGSGWRDGFFWGCIACLVAFTIFDYMR